MIHLSAEAASESLFEAGLAVRREVLGSEYVDRSTAATDPLSLEFQEFVTTYCWGSIWKDERLQRRERSLLVLGITAALGRMSEFELHIRGAMNNGLTEQELIAALKQIGVYAGIPAAVSASHVLREVLKEADRIRVPEDGSQGHV